MLRRNTIDEIIYIITKWKWARETKFSFFSKSRYSRVMHRVTISRSRSEKSNRKMSYKRIRSRELLRSRKKKKTNVKFSYVIEFEAFHAHHFTQIQSRLFEKERLKQPREERETKKKEKNRMERRNATIKFSMTFREEEFPSSRQLLRRWKLKKLKKGNGRWSGSKAVSSVCKMQDSWGVHA